MNASTQAPAHQRQALEILWSFSIRDELMSKGVWDGGVFLDAGYNEVTSKFGGPSYT